jgi:hypothetical protein
MAQKNIWTDEEKDFVMSKYKKGYSFKEIEESGKIKRSAYAIELRIGNIIYDKIQGGLTYEDLAEEYKKSKEDIMELEKKIFQMKHKSDVTTSYTNDGGYTLNEKNINDSNINLGDMHHINRTMQTVLNFYENIARLNKLKQDKLIDNDFYNDLMKGLNEFTFDKQKIIDSIKLKKSEKSEKTDKSEKPKKSDKKYDNNSDSKDDDIPKKMKKRLI